MQRYHEISHSCNACVKSGVKCTHPPPTSGDKLREILKKPTMKAFLLVNSLFVISQFTGAIAMRPYSIQILKAYNVPIDANWATMLSGLVGLSSNIILVFIIRFVGKRSVTLVSTFGSILSCAALAVFGHLYLPEGINSFELPSNMTTPDEGNYLPLYAFMSLNFFTSMGLMVIPWLLVSEVFPFK